MEYTTQCRLCENHITITVDDADDEAAKEVGFDAGKWMEKGAVLCERCRVYKETGYRPTNTPPMKDFLFAP